MKLSTLPVVAILALLVWAETSMATSGTLAPPPDEAIYLRIAQIPNGEWSETDIEVLQRDGTAITTAYLRCAVAVLEDASACPWLPYDVSLEDAKYIHAAFQSVIFGVKSGSPLSAADLFARHGPSAALADMLLGDHEVSTVYASMITAAYGEDVTRRYFTDGALGHYLHVLALEPSSVRAKVAYWYGDSVKHSFDLLFTRARELGAGAVDAFVTIHADGETLPRRRNRGVACNGVADDEFLVMSALFAMADDPRFDAVVSEPWPGTTEDCRLMQLNGARLDRLYRVRWYSRVALALSDNQGYRSLDLPLGTYVLD